MPIKGRKLVVFGLGLAAAISAVWAVSMPAQAATAFVQNTNSGYQFSVKADKTSFASNVTKNDLIIFVAQSVTNKSFPVNVTSSCVTGNLTVVGTSTGGDGGTAAWGYGLINASGACSVNASYSASQAGVGLTLTEISGESASSPLDVATSSTDVFRTSHLAGHATTTASGDYIFAAFVNAGSENAATYTPGTGYTARAYVHNMIFTEDQMQASAGSISPSATSSASQSDNNIVMAFRSASVSIDTTPPSVKWIAPALNATVSSAVTLTASSTDNVAVASVAFYINTISPSTLIGTATSPSGTLYSVSWNTTNIANGSTTLIALSTDTSNNTSTTSTTVNVENAPVISGVSASAATSSAAIAWTTSHAASSQVNYGLTSAYGSSTATSTLVVSHSLTLQNLVASTTYHYQILSADAQGNTATTTDATFVIGGLPVINSFSASPAIVASAGTSTLSWNVSNASSITIMPNSFSTGTLVGSMTVNPTSTTIYTLIPTNGEGISTATTTVSIDTTPPSVKWIAPALNATVSSAVTLTASSTDNVAVASVAFYINTISPSTLIGTATSPSGTLYSVSWNTTNIANGSTTLIALSTDTSNNTSTTSTTVNVENAPHAAITPGVGTAFSSFTPGITNVPVTVVAGSNTALFVSIADEFGSISAVTYNGVALTELWNKADGANVEHSSAWILANPSTGANTLSITWSGGDTIAGYAEPWYGVAQGNTQGTTWRAPTFGNDGGNGSATASELASNAVSGDMVLDVMADYGAIPTANSSQTVQNQQNKVFGNGLSYGASDKAAVGSTAMSWTLPNSSFWALGVVPLIPAVSGPADTTPPAVAWVAPISNTVVSSAVTLVASSTDNVSVASVAFYINNISSSTLIASVANPSGNLYSTSWNTSSATNGSTTLIALSTDTSNNTSTTSTTVNVENAPVISGIFTSAASTTATISWITNEPATSEVDYGLTSAYGSSTVSQILVTNHSILLTGLTQGVTYHYRVTSVDASGNVSTSSDSTVTPNDTPVITLVHHSESSNCGDSTTCSVTLSGPITAGDLLVIMASTNNAVYIQSINAGGTFVDGFDRTIGAGQGFLSAGYVTSASATAGPVVVTFSGTTGGAQVNIREYSASSGSLGFDAVADNMISNNVSSSFSGPALTLSGTDDVIVQSADLNAHVASISSPWSTNEDISNDETGAGFADNMNTTSGSTPPIWSANSTAGNSGGLAMAFGISPTPCTNTALMDSNAGTDGAGPTSADLTSSTFGAAVTGNSITNWSWGVVNPSSSITYSAAAHKALASSPPRFCVGGETYADNGNLGLKYDTTAGSGGNQYLELFMPGNDFGQTADFTSPDGQAAAGMWFNTSLAQTSTINADFFLIGAAGATNSDFINAILYGNGNQLGITCESPTNTCTGGTIPISSNTWYWITIGYATNGGTNHISVYAADGTTLVGSLTATANSGFNPPLELELGDRIASPITPGAYIYMDKVEACYLGTCNFPLLP